MNYETKTVFSILYKPDVWTSNPLKILNEPFPILVGAVLGPYLSNISFLNHPFPFDYGSKLPTQEQKNRHLNLHFHFIIIL